MRRLQTRAQFQAVLASMTVARTAHFALHRRALNGAQALASSALFGGAGDVWIGAITPKRWARRAVTRNAIRRQVYALAHEFAARLPAAAHLVRLRAGFDRSRFRSADSPALRVAVCAELRALFERAAFEPAHPAAVLMTGASATTS
ncbi:MAG: ribonuclease P protein component [Burkholderiaceae bacterium]|nr:ribonuclease P protein component [Burkholderiaceae bacterium]